MDLLLTPLVSKFLRQYVKRSAEGAGSDLKVGGPAAAAVGCKLWRLCTWLPGWCGFDANAQPCLIHHACASSAACPRAALTHRRCRPPPTCTTQVSFSRGNVLTLHNLELNLVGCWRSTITHQHRQHGRHYALSGYLVAARSGGMDRGPVNCCTAHTPRDSRHTQAPLLGGAAALAHVQRAFARRLSITIPWTALTSQPIQVRPADGRAGFLGACTVLQPKPPGALCSA